jgi:hypothetical protein
MSEFPGNCSRVKAMWALAPVAYVNNLKSPPLIALKTAVGPAGVIIVVAIARLTHDVQLYDMNPDPTMIQYLSLELNFLGKWNSTRITKQ